AALQGERSDGAALVVVEVGGGAGAIALQLLNLGKISGVDEQQPGQRTNQRGDQDQKSEEHTANDLAAGNLDLGKVLVQGFHGVRGYRIAGTVSRGVAEVGDVGMPTTNRTATNSSITV